MAAGEIFGKRAKKEQFDPKQTAAYGDLTLRAVAYRLESNVPAEQSDTEEIAKVVADKAAEYGLSVDEMDSLLTAFRTKAQHESQAE